MSTDLGRTLEPPRSCFRLCRRPRTLRFAVRSTCAFRLRPLTPNSVDAVVSWPRVAPSPLPRADLPLLLSRFSAPSATTAQQTCFTHVALPL